MPLAALVEQHQADLRQLIALAGGDLLTLFDSVNTPDQARDALLTILPQLVELYGAAAASLAADWYDDVRLEERVAGSFRAAVVELPDKGRTDALARWSVGSLYQAVPDYAIARVKAAGGLQRIIADASRNTIASSSVKDPRARGWQRTGSGNCGFCALLISRGAVYTEASAQFASHDHCNCSAAPAFSARAEPVKPYTPSDRVVTDADRARTRAYIQANGL